MAHRLETARGQHIVDDVVDLGSLRVYALESGAAVVLTADEITRDGSPVLGGVSVVPWGDSAIFRAEGQRVAVVWDARGRSIVARGGAECWLCSGEFDVANGERAETCACGVGFHADCYELVITCQECGRPHGEV